MDNTEDLLRRLRAAAAEAKEKSLSLELLLRATIVKIEELQRIIKLNRAEINRLQRQVEEQLNHFRLTEKTIYVQVEKGAGR